MFASAKNPVELVFSDLALANSAPNNWRQADGSWGSFGSAKTFDFRPYRWLHAVLSAGSLTGSSPTIQLILIKVDALVSGATGSQITISQTIPAGGGSAEAHFGEQPGFAIAGASYNITNAFVPGRLVFARLGIQQGGTVSTIVGGRLLIYGVRG